MGFSGRKSAARPAGRDPLSPLIDFTLADGPICGPLIGLTSVGAEQ